MESVLVEVTLDDRKVEVIDGWLCLDGRPEVRELVVLDEHPNRQAVLKVAPQAALRRMQDRFDGSAPAVAERLRQAVWQKSFAEGAE